MKQFLLSIIMTLSASLLVAQPTAMRQDMFADMKPNDKAVVVAVHFGTTNTEARQNAIEKFNARLRNEFPLCDFREAWTSRAIVEKLGNKGEVILTPTRLFSELRNLGYTHILVQPSFIINGMEMQHLRNEVQAAKRNFKHLRLGEPLLTSIHDYEMAILATAAAYGDEKTGNVLVCHGTKGALNSGYTMIDYMLRDKGMTNWYVTTIEGYPDMESLERELKTRKEKRVNLIPFLMLKGKHFTSDIATDMKNRLESLGYKVNLTQHSLGEANEILDIFMEHAKYASKNRTLTSTEQKLIEAAK